MKKLIAIAGIALFLFSCSGNKSNEGGSDSGSFNRGMLSDSAKEAEDYSKGIGKFTQVDVGPGIDEKMAALGQGVYDLKCAACHKLTADRLVGPGWLGVTEKRKPEWIMNFVTNVEEMLEKDPESQAMLEICMVKMPNQNLTDEDARNVLEFMRKNDGAK